MTLRSCQGCADLEKWFAKGMFYYRCGRFNVPLGSANDHPMDWPREKRSGCWTEKDDG